MASSSLNGRTQLLLSLALLALLLLFTMLQSSSSEPRPYDLTSAAPNGLLALRLWLLDMGYDLEETMGDDFQLPASTELLLIWANGHPYTAAEAETLQAWLAKGGTAVIMGTQTRNEELFKRFGVRPGAPTPLFFTVTPQQPLVPGVAKIELSDEYPALDLSAAPVTVPIFASDNGAVTVALQSYGAGTLWQLSGHHTLINAQLRDPAQAALLLAFLRNVKAGGTVRLDTYHLWGPATSTVTTAQTLQEWIYHTTWGWALLFLLGATALFLLLQGRRLGPSLPAQAEVRRREAAEYVMAMANLARRARHRATIKQHHKQRLKRILGHRAHIDPTLNDNEFLQQLASSERLTTTLETESDALINDVGELLQRLDKAQDERTLVEAVARIDALVKQ